MKRVFLLCLTLALLSPRMAETAESSKPMASTLVELEAHLPTQARLEPWHPVEGESISVAGATYPVQLKGRNLVVARTVNGKRTVTLTAPARVILTLVMGKKKQPLPLHFRRSTGGWEYAPASAREFRLHRSSFRLVDVNLDGRFDEVGVDAIQYPPSPFLLPLEQVIILGRVQLQIESSEADGSRIMVIPTDLEGEDQVLDGVEAINEFRTEIGLPPVVADPELTSACTKHARYLVDHGVLRKGWNPHFEARGLKGYSEEGNRAGMRSVIVGQDHVPGVRAHVVTYYHRFAFLNPLVREMGVSGGTRAVSVIDGKSRVAATEPPGPWRDPILYPADGTREFASNFHSAGESPSPVEHAPMRGNPLTVLFLERDPGVEDFKGTLWELGRKGEREIPLLVPKSRGAGNRFGFIPERALKSSAEYRVRYSWTQRGEGRVLEARFRAK